MEELVNIMEITLTAMVTKKLEEEYGICSIRYEEMKNTMLKHNYIIMDRCNKKWFIKYYPFSFGQHNLNQLGLVHNWLEHHGFPVCKVEKNKITGNFFLQIDTRYYVVYSFIEAKPADSKDIERVIDGVNKIHMISDESFKRMLMSTSDRIQFAQMIYSRILQSEYRTFREYLGNRIQYIEKLLEVEKDSYDTVIHGDLNLKNILVNKDMVYFIDFDEIRIGSPIEDLASLIYSMLYQNGVLIKQNQDAICKLIDYFFNGRPTYEDIESTNRILKLNSIYYLMERAEHYPYLKRHKSTLCFMNNLLEILENDVVLRLYDEKGCLCMH